jgi:hypothetical protein
MPSSQPWLFENKAVARCSCAMALYANPTTSNVTAGCAVKVDRRGRGAGASEAPPHFGAPTDPAPPN